MRLQKYLALAGVASRRRAEELIAQGRVSVNGTVVRQMGQQVDSGDTVCFDGKPVAVQMRKRYIMLNKPFGVMTTMDDPQGRPTVAQLTQEITERIVPVGRLDFETEGLLLLTNDGELVNRLTHPRYHVEKTYYARIGGQISDKELDRLARGVDLPDGYHSAPAKLRAVTREHTETIVEVVVSEGHNRLVRQLFEAAGKHLIGLRRERIGTLSLGGLQSGRWRHLTPGEVQYLKQLTGMRDEIGK